MTLEREFYLKETNTEAEHWWLTPVTLAIQRQRSGVSQFEASLGK
jgi:hypothetical protein